MATERLSFIQIIYDDIQAQHCYPFATVYKNETLTPYFENAIISDLVPRTDSDFIGVLSWRLSRKRGDMYRLHDKSLTLDKLRGETYDIAILTPRGHRDIRQKFMHWHRSEGAERALKEFDKFIKMPEEVEHAIYENHFIAKREIYQEYVKDCLIPAINFMEERKEIFMADAGYINRKSGKEKELMFKKLAEWGKVDYPIAPFILERLFSMWINKKGFKVIPL